MSGLLLLGVLGIWLVIVIFTVKWLIHRLKPSAFNIIFVVMVTIVMLVLPVADELISAPLFYKLCEEGTKLKFDPEKIRGRTIFLAENPQPRITVGLLNGYYIPWEYADAVTKEKLITSKSYHVNGGLFIRALGISETNAPLTMPSYCASPEKPWQKSFLIKYDLKYIEREDVK